MVAHNVLVRAFRLPGPEVRQRVRRGSRTSSYTASVDAKHVHARAKKRDSIAPGIARASAHPSERTHALWCLFLSLLFRAADGKMAI